MNILKKVQAKLQKRIQKNRVKQWFKDNGNETHNLNFDINENSIVFEIGGYTGVWSEKIIHKYNPNLYIFEPLPEYVEILKDKFKTNSKVKVFDFGLSDKTEEVEFNISNDGSSIFRESDNKVKIKLKSIKEFLEENKISNVDLANINIEGSEYPLLKFMLDNNLVTVFKNIQVQFHDFIVPKAKQKMNEIQERLSKTHHLTYQYHFVWENWKRNN